MLTVCNAKVTRKRHLGKLKPPRDELPGETDGDFQLKMAPNKGYLKDPQHNTPMIHQSKVQLPSILQI